jgi:hypothetical protein
MTAGGGADGEGRLEHDGHPGGRLGQLPSLIYMNHLFAEKQSAGAHG